VSGRTAYRVGDAVDHRRFGAGEVTAIRDGTMVVRFGAQERIFVPGIAPLTKMGQSGEGGGASVYG
jgi:DNA helicase II / ATP-dependent DNA helicase PcrA